MSEVKIIEGKKYIEPEYQPGIVDYINPFYPMIQIHPVDRPTAQLIRYGSYGAVAIVGFLLLKKK